MNDYEYEWGDTHPAEFADLIDAEHTDEQAVA
jgi:hypothetical protein